MEIRPQKKVSSACSCCKLRKRKCSATLPCASCIANGKECVYGDTPDGRRKESIHRARLDSAFHKKLLHCLLDKLRHGKDASLKAMIEEHASIEDIATYLVATTPQPIFPVDAVGQGQDREDSDEYSREDLGTLLKSFKKTLYPNRRRLNPSRASHTAPRYVEVSGNLPFSAALPVSGVDAKCQEQQVSNVRLPPYMVQPLNFPVDHLSITALFTNFRDSCRAAISLGVAEEIVLGPQPVNLETALRGHRLDIDFTPSTWICEVQQKFESFDIYVRLMTIFFIHQYLRWVICPTAENYSLLPDCMQLTLSQRLIPHHAAIDLCHLPALRDVLVQRDYASHANNDDREDIVVSQLAGIRTNWEGSWDDAVVFDSKLGYCTLTQRFIETASKVEEWTAGRIMLSKFPELEGKMRFAEEETIAVDNRQLYEVLQLRPWSVYINHK